MTLAVVLWKTHGHMKRLHVWIDTGGGSVMTYCNNDLGVANDLFAAELPKCANCLKAFAKDEDSQ